MQDEIIDAVLASGIQADARWQHPLVGWIVIKDPADYPGRFTARLVTNIPSPYILVADTLAEIHAQLPPKLERSERQSADLPVVVEIWFSAQLMPR